MEEQQSLADRLRQQLDILNAQLHSETRLREEACAQNQLKVNQIQEF